MIAFKLDTAPKIPSGFKVPDGYFENFGANIHDKLPQNDVKVIPISRRIKWIYAAAAIVVAALAVPIYNNLKRPETNLDKATIENYLSHATISEEDFAELLDERDIEQINIDTPIEDKAIEDLLSVNSNIEEYVTN